MPCRLKLSPTKTLTGTFKNRDPTNLTNNGSKFNQSITTNRLFHERIALFRVIEYVPGFFRDVLERLFESLWSVLLLDANGCNVVDSANENEFYPVLVFTVSKWDVSTMYENVEM